MAYRFSQKAPCYFLVIIFVFALSIFIHKPAYSAEQGIVKGIVTDKSSKAPLPGIAITVEGTNILEFTNEKGEYQIRLAPGTYKLRAELLGYNPAEALGVIVVDGETNQVNFTLAQAGVVEGEETVVTGERQDVPLSKTTASVAIVGAKDIEKLGAVTNASDLIKNTPGVQVESGGSEFAKTIKIRGRTIAPPSVNSAGILLLVDGVPANDPASGYANMYQIPSENIEKIEVLKGASSAQYGGQASAGVINIITKKGQRIPVTKASMEFGTYQRRSKAEDELYENYTFYHSWGNKYFDYAFSGSYSHLSGITSAEKSVVATAQRLYGEKHPGTRLPDGSKKFSDRIETPFMTGADLNELMDVGDHDKGEKYSAELNLGINLFKGNALRISPSYLNTNFFLGFSPGSKALESPTDTFLQFFLNVINKREAFNVSDKWEITPNLTYNFRMGLTKNTGGAVFITVGDFVKYNKEAKASGKKDHYVTLNGVSPFNPLPGITVDRALTLANDISYKFDIFDGNVLTVGQEYQWAKSQTPPDLILYNKPTVKHNIHSLFLQDLLTVKDFSLSVGGRWDQATTFIENFDDEFSPRFGINYSINPGTSLRFSVGRARRFEDFARQNGLGQSNGRLWGNPTIGPEVNWTYELGFRFATKYISGDIAYFYDDYAGLEIPVPLSAIGYGKANGDPRVIKYSREVLGVSKAQLSKFNINTTNPRAGTFINGPDAVFQGFDVSVDVKPIENWDISVSYLFQRAVSGNNNPFDFGQGKAQAIWVASDGKSLGPKFQDEMRIAYMPTHIFKVSSDYTMPFGLRLDISGRYKSTTDFFSGSYATGIFRQPEHWIWDYKMTQPLFNGKLNVSFSIDNVFSKLYYEQGGIPSNVARYVIGFAANF
ncbi:MAG: TonB-dependent receptor [Candidatus Schekmanbacteria bacterium]|nr:TonB-dependent receptor [Candidatus Schekmanbacteria bacterium]